MEEALSLLGVSVDYTEGAATTRILSDISFSISPNRITAVIGESGSGKTTLAQSITSLFPNPDRYSISGSITLGDRAILHGTEKELREIRERHIRFIPQDPARAFNPLMTVGRQMADAAAHLRRADIPDALRRVGLKNPPAILDAYPHELSGGMLQLVSIAMAIAPRPAVLVADEPTSSLDSENRDRVMRILDDLRGSGRLSILIITHDPLVVEQYADDVIVLYAGRIVERASQSEFFAGPLHPYSRILVDARRDFDTMPRMNEELSVRSRRERRGCAFQARCPAATDICGLHEPPPDRIGANRWIRCFNWKSTI